MKLKEKIVLYSELKSFLETEGLRHLETVIVLRDDIKDNAKKIILNLPDPDVVPIKESFIVSFAWEIKSGHLEVIYGLEYKEKPMHIYATMLLSKDESIFMGSDKPEIERDLKEDDINYVRTHHSEYAKYTSKSSRSNTVITHTDTGLELSFLIHESKDKAPVFYPLSREAHVIVGSDNNKHLETIIDTMIRSVQSHYTPQEIQFVISSNYPEQFNDYKLFMYQNQPVIEDVNKLIQALKHLEQMMTDRFKLFDSHQVRDIKMFNFKQMNEVEKLPYIGVVIYDIEIDDNDIKETYYDILMRLTQRSRAAGIHLIMLTTKPYRNISNQFGYLIPNRLAFRLYQTYDSMALLGTKDACNLRYNEYLCETYKHIYKK